MGKQETSKEDKVMNLIKDLYDKIPEPISMEEVLNRINPQDESNPLKVVVVQEIQRYNVLLVKVKRQLVQLDQGIRGLVLISEELEAVMEALFEGKVPDSWKFVYYSLKSLHFWTDDLIQRIK
jgi:dynein heavy chain, axonemal